MGIKFPCTQRGCLQTFVSSAGSGETGWEITAHLFRAAVKFLSKSQLSNSSCQRAPALLWRDPPLRIRTGGVFNVSFQTLPFLRSCVVLGFYDMDARPLGHEPRPPNSFCRDHQTAIWDQLACHYSSSSDLNCWPTSESPYICLPAMCRAVQLSNEKSFLHKQSWGGRALSVHRLLWLAWTQEPRWAQLDREVGVPGASSSVTTGCWLEKNGSR